jgi:hypothetical protein
VSAVATVKAAARPPHSKNWRAALLASDSAFKDFKDKDGRETGVGFLWEIGVSDAEL